MRFEDLIRQGKVIKGEIDIEKAKAVLKMSENNLGVCASIDLTDISASPVLTMAYESLRQVVEAMCLTEGYKVYSHEAL